MTQSTGPEAPAEAATDAPTGSPAQPKPTLPEGFSELDSRAIDTARVLAMDAVQKVGNGHPGTAMSLAPAAYLLFQRLLRHDPTDPNWVGRDRFVLSPGHASLTLYIQLYLSGYGMTLDDLKALRTWGSQTPGHPEHGHTPGVETTTGPLGQGVGNAVGMAMAARFERGLLDPDAARARACSTTPSGDRLRRRHGGGRQRRGVLAGRHQQLGNLVARLRRQPHLDRGRHRRRVHRGRRQALRGLRLARPAGRRRRGRGRDRRGARRRQGRDRPPVVHLLRTIIGWPAPNKQNTGKAHGSALGADEVKATKEILGFDPEQTFDVADEVLEHAREVVDRGRKAHAEWQERFDAWSGATRSGAALLTG